jgi:hypothetical protein
MAQPLGRAELFALALMSGFLVLDFLVRLWTPGPSGVGLLTLIVVLTAWWAKEQYWRFIDTTSARSTTATATLLGSRGKVRMLEPPHTEENYLLKEMGFRIARAPGAPAPGRPAHRLRCALPPQLARSGHRRSHRRDRSGIAL